jgi:hypothetical protein
MLVWRLNCTFVLEVTGSNFLDSRVGQDFFSTASRPALGHTHPSLYWVLVSVSAGVKRSGREAEHYFPSSAEIKNVDLYFHSPICLHVTMLNQLNTGTTLPLSYTGNSDWLCYGFSRSLQAIPGTVLLFGHGYFLPFLYNSRITIRRYIVWDTDSKVRWTTEKMFITFWAMNVDALCGHNSCCCSVQNIYLKRTKLKAIFPLLLYMCVNLDLFSWGVEQSLRMLQSRLMRRVLGSKGN